MEKISKHLKIDDHLPGSHIQYFLYFKWGKVFKSGLSKFCERQPLKNFLIPLLNTLFQIQDRVLNEQFS